MTPVQDAVADQIDSQQYVEVPLGGNKRNKSENFSFLLLADATETIVHHAFWLAQQKRSSHVLSTRSYFLTRAGKVRKKSILK